MHISHDCSRASTSVGPCLLSGIIVGVGYNAAAMPWSKRPDLHVYVVKC
jgi:hypothetical protein